MNMSRRIAVLFLTTLVLGSLTLGARLAAGRSQGKQPFPATPPKPGEVWLNSKDGLRYVWIPW